MTILETYLSKDTRNLRARELKNAGLVVVRRRSVGSRMHPEYIKDFVGQFQTGFGNRDYLQTWGVLYHIEAKDAAR